MNRWIDCARARYWRSLDDDQRGERSRVDEMKPLDREAVLRCRGGEPLPELMLTQRDRPPASAVARDQGAQLRRWSFTSCFASASETTWRLDVKWLTPA